MRVIKLKRLFSVTKNYPLQMFVTGATFSAVGDISVDFREYTIPNATSLKGIKFFQLQEKINGFVNLENNWDSYNANPISTVSIETALEVLNNLNNNDIFSEGIEINVFPMRDGGVQFEFDSKYFCAELEISSQGQMTYLLFDENANILHKEIINSYDLPELSNLLLDGIYAK